MMTKTVDGVRPRSSGDHLALLQATLVQQGYAVLVIEDYMRAAARFLAHLAKSHVSIARASERDVEAFVTEAKEGFVARNDHPPRGLGSWRGSLTAPARMLLRLRPGGAPKPGGPYSRLIAGYERWLRDLRGLAPLSVRQYSAQASAFLAWVTPRTGSRGLRYLDVADVDGYLGEHALSLKRVTRKTTAILLRCFLRHLYSEGVTARDLTAAVWKTRVYEYERPPLGLREDEVAAVLAVTRADRTAGGLRDHAMLVLLATYGFRSAEVAQLRLDDIDWRHERIRVRHNKRGPISDLPLLPEVGTAVLAYLQRGRPRTALRELFIRARAPRERPLLPCALYKIVRTRLRQAGVQPEGKRGPHAFRHGRAVALLRAGVAIKAIGDILGHSRPSSTQAYLRLQTEDLREVALGLPGGSR